MDQDINGTMTDADFDAIAAQIAKRRRQANAHWEEAVREGNAAVLDVPVDDIIDWKQDGDTDQ